MHVLFCAYIYLYKLFLKKFIEPRLNRSDRLNLDPFTSPVQLTVRVLKHCLFVGNLDCNHNCVSKNCPLHLHCHHCHHHHYTVACIRRWWNSMVTGLFSLTFLLRICWSNSDYLQAMWVVHFLLYKHPIYHLDEKM